MSDMSISVGNERSPICVAMLACLITLGACSETNAVPEDCGTPESIAGFKSAIVANASGQSIGGLNNIKIDPDVLSIEDVTFTSLSADGSLKCAAAAVVTFPKVDNGLLAEKKNGLLEAGIKIPTNISNGRAKSVATFERKKRLDKDGYVYQTTSSEPELIGALFLSAALNAESKNDKSGLKPFGQSTEQKELQSNDELTFIPSQLPNDYQEYSGVTDGGYCHFRVGKKLVYATDFASGVFGFNDMMFTADYETFGEPFNQPKKWDDYNIRMVVTGTDSGNFSVNFKAMGKTVQSREEEGSTPVRMTVVSEEAGVKGKTVVGRADGVMACGA